jgi:8-oxo-dGTP diphosphatase
VDEISKEIHNTFGQQLRVRVSGFCLVNDQLLLVRHRGLGKTGELWAPPGGGVKFGETVHQALEREFWEETGLQIRVGRFVCVHEFLEQPLHAVELFFEVHLLSGTLFTGIDPEMQSDERAHQIIQEVRWIGFEELVQMDTETLHQLLRHCRHPQDVLNLRGYSLNHSGRGK